MHSYLFAQLLFLSMVYRMILAFHPSEHLNQSYIWLRHPFPLNHTLEMVLHIQVEALLE